MSEFRDLIARMAVDAEFARHTRANPDEAARRYALTPDETEQLRGLADTSATAGPTALGARLSKSGIGTGGLAGLLDPTVFPHVDPAPEPDPATLYEIHPPDPILQVDLTQPQIPPVPGVEGFGFPEVPPELDLPGDDPTLVPMPDGGLTLIPFPPGDGPTLIPVPEPTDGEPPVDQPPLDLAAPTTAPTTDPAPTEPTGPTAGPEPVQARVVAGPESGDSGSGDVGADALLLGGAATAAAAAAVVGGVTAGKALTSKKDQNRTAPS